VKERGGSASPQERKHLARHPGGTQHAVPSPGLGEAAAALTGTCQESVFADARKSQGNVTESQNH